MKSFGAGMFVSPHKLTLDDGGNLWLADNGGHQVFKMTPDGRVLIAGGKDINGAVLSSTEILAYNSNTTSGSISAGPAMSYPRSARGWGAIR